MRTFSKKFLVINCSVLMPAISLEAQSPNIVFILADDLGYGDISALNPNSKIRTTEIDKLSHNGITFTDAHSGSSVSTPSRYGLLTGRYAFRTSMKNGVLDGYSKPLISPERNTIASLLSKYGYSTACIGKWHLGWDWAYNPETNEVDYSKPISNGPISRGFDYFYGMASSLDMPPYVYVEQNQPTAIPNRISKADKGLKLFRAGPQSPDFEPEDCLPNFTKRAIDYIVSKKDNAKPFFLYLPLTAPHTPILPSEKFQGRSGLSPYGDFVLMVDDAVGQIVETLKQNGLYDNTIIVFTSDNGCFHGAGMRNMEAQGHYSSYIYRGSKSDIYDGGHRVPLIISWGNKHDRVREEGIISMTDFYSSFADMVGHKQDSGEGEDSYSFWPVISGVGKSIRTDVVHHSIDGSFSIREGKWKLIFCAGSGGWSFPSLPKDEEAISKLPELQLYDMSSNPEESENLVDKEPEVVERLTTKMRKYISDGRSTPGIRQKNETTGEWTQTRLFVIE